MIELDPISGFAASIYIFIGFMSKNGILLECFLCAEYRHLRECSERERFSRSFTSKRSFFLIQDLKTELLQCSDLHFVTCNVPAKVMHTTYSHKKCVKLRREFRGNQAKDSETDKWSKRKDTRRIFTSINTS